MEIVPQKKISSEDILEINAQVKADLIEHLYRGCLPGTITGVIVSIILFIDYYGHTPTNLLISWIAFFNFMMFALSGLFFFYNYYKTNFGMNEWEQAYSILMLGCAIAWLPGIYLIPHETTRQYIALIALFLASTGYSTGTIGQFRLCVVTLFILLMPLVLWCFYQSGIFYTIVGIYALVYMLFLVSANFRSTKYFKESLRLKLENTLVSYQANHDVLTNLPNQRILPELLTQAIAFVKNKTKLFALVSFSLNRMELIDDSIGQHASNAIIKAVSDRLQLLSSHLARIKEVTQYLITISRKDTFNIILVPVDPDDIESKIRLLFTVLDEPFFIEQQRIKLTASLGATIYKKDSIAIEALISNADAAMLRAKQYGGNRLEFYKKEINALLPKQIEMEHDLFNVLKNKELRLFYQPLVNLKSGRIYGMEALIRWKHPVHGFISPVQFIPLAEENGLIIPIGEWVLEEACRQTGIWHSMGFGSLKVSVNLAVKQLRSDNILARIKDILAKMNYYPKYLELELTETAILDESVIPFIKSLKDMGVSVAVDDFGTGYSGLSYLKRFSVDKLKIDQSFIRDIPANNDSITIVSAIIAMAKELKIHTLAEGVETIEQVNFLKEKGCEYVQGYYFSKPLEADHFTELLLNQRKLTTAN